MTLDEFKRQPLLMSASAVLAAMGRPRHALRKMVDCGVLTEVQPAGAGQKKYQKRQVALILQWPLVVTQDEELKAFRAESGLLREKAFLRYTGYCRATCGQIRQARGAGYVRVPGLGAGFRKIEVARLLGWPELV